MKKIGSTQKQSMTRLALWFALAILGVHGGEDSEILTTTECASSRTSFPVRLDTIYLYHVEYIPGTALNVQEIENAIDMAVASAMESCNKQQQPEYGVEHNWDGMHEIVTGGTCSNRADVMDQCSLIRGVTSVLMSSVSPGTEDIVYDMIQSILQDELFLHRLTTTNVLRLNFLRPIGENLAFPNQEGEDSTNSRASFRAAVISAVLSFGCTATILLGLYLRREDGARGPLQKRVAHFVAAHHRKFFQDLDDDKSRPVRMAATDDTETRAPAEGAITWSVSDLTSDAESIISSLRLDRIEEEDGEEGSDENMSLETGPMPRRYSASCSIAKMEFVPSWDSHKVSLVPQEVDIRDEEAGAFSDFMKADISWLEDKDESQLNPNESQEVSEGTLIGCAFLGEESQEVSESNILGFVGEHGSLSMSAEDIKVITTSDGHAVVLTNSGEEDDDDDDDDESKYHSPSSSHGKRIMPEEDDTVYLSSSQSPRSSPTAEAANPLGSPDVSTSTDGSQHDGDMFLLSWAREALAKLKQGEVPIFGLEK